MNISSLNLFNSNYSTWLTNWSQANRNTDSTQASGSTGKFANRLSNADGDTFQMSTRSMKQGGMPPMMGGMPTKSGSGVDLGSFLEKVKNGTVTEADLEGLKTQLTEAQNQTDSTTGSSESSEETDIRDSIKDLLDKVKAGTVTEEDLSEMKDLLTNAQASGGMSPMGGGRPPMMGGGPPPSDENSEAIGSFLDKVKNGTVTESDLTDLQELLTSIQEDSDSTEETSTTTSDTSSIKDSVESFLDKVKAGTVTEDDLSEMQEQLADTQASVGMPPMGRR